MRATEHRPEVSETEDAGLDPRAGKGNVQRKVGAAAPAPAPAKGKELDRLVGMSVKDGGGFTFVLDADHAFRVIGAPPGSETSINKRLTATDPNARIASAWEMLAARIEREHPAPHVEDPAIPAPAPPPAAPPAEEPSLISSALELVRDTVSTARDFFSGLVSGVTDGIGGLLGGGSEAAPAPTAPAKDAAPAPAPPAPAKPDAADSPIAPASTDGKQDNLAIAKQLVDSFNVPHSWDKAKYAEETAGDPENMARVKLIAAGETTGLKSIVCSEFTSLTLAKAGWDLMAEYRDLATGLPVAYLNAKGKPTKKQPIPPPKFVTYYGVVNIWAADVAAMIAAQSGGAERIEPGSERAKEVGAGDRTEAFLYTSANTLEGGVAVDEDTEFGAGAVAASLGGKTIERDDRKPGDLQQVFKTSDGKTVGAGHSSQVWSVRGPGVAQLGAANGPTLHGTPATPVADLEPGWYEVGGDGLAWEIGADTDPATVARIAAAEVQTIDANIYREKDATAIGGFEKQKAYSKEGASMAYSDGRLPTSKWWDWTPRADVEVKAHLTAAVKTAAKKK